MQLTINDTNNLSALDIQIMTLLLGGAQPAVASNTGTLGSVPSSADAKGVSVDGAGEVVDAAKDPAPSAPEKPKRTRTKKEELAASAAENPTAAPADGALQSSTQEAGSQSMDEEPAPTVNLANESPETKSYTMDDIRGALQLYTGKHGMPKAIELLKAYNAGRISEVKPDDYAEFVKDCNE